MIKGKTFGMCLKAIIFPNSTKQQAWVLEKLTSSGCSQEIRSGWVTNHQQLPSYSQCFQMHQSSSRLQLSVMVKSVSRGLMGPSMVAYP